MKKETFRFLALFLAGWLGGFTAQWLFPVAPALAQGRVLQADQLWIYAQDGKYRMQMGTYSSGTEQGQPLIGLSDTGSHLRLLLRLAGPDHSPVLVFKDKNGRDRLVLGLNYSGGEETPFITYTDEAGNPRSLLK